MAAAFTPQANTKPSSASKKAAAAAALLPRKECLIYPARVWHKKEFHIEYRMRWQIA
jgi:hypothetical protein